MDERTARDREEPPLVQGLIVDGLHRTESSLRGVLRSIDRRILIWCWGLGAIGIFVLVVSASIASSPSLSGVLQGIGGGAFLALLFAVAFGGLLLWSRDAPKRAPAASPRSAELEARLGPALRELNALRAETITQVKARSRVRVPAGMITAVAAWIAVQSRPDPPGVFELLLFLLVGALAGEYWAAHALGRQYRRRYKDSILPMIASDLGSLTYRQAEVEEVRRLGGQRIVPDFDRITADDEIVGVYHGLPIRITEVSLRRRRQKKSVVVFDGLFVAITLPRTLTATTVIMTDRGAWENVKTRWRDRTLEAVRLEHGAFEERYEIYSTDQIEARALLTPAFMERFVALTNSSTFSVPGAIAEENTLVVALPKRFGAGDLFEPPPYWKPAGGTALVRLENDIHAVLEMADAVIGLDFWAAGRRGHRDDSPAPGSHHQRIVAALPGTARPCP